MTNKLWCLGRPRRAATEPAKQDVIRDFHKNFGDVMDTKAGFKWLESECAEKKDTVKASLSGPFIWNEG